MPTRTRKMTRTEVRTRAQHAHAFLTAADLVVDLGHDAGIDDLGNTIGSLAVLAGIAAGDAICGAVLSLPGSRSLNAVGFAGRPVRVTSGSDGHALPRALDEGHPGTLKPSDRCRHEEKRARRSSGRVLRAIEPLLDLVGVLQADLLIKTVTFHLLPDLFCRRARRHAIRIQARLVHPGSKRFILVRKLPATIDLDELAAVAPVVITRRNGVRRNGVLDQVSIFLHRDDVEPSLLEASSEASETGSVFPTGDHSVSDRGLLLSGLLNRREILTHDRPTTGLSGSSGATSRRKDGGCDHQTEKSRSSLHLQSSPFSRLPFRVAGDLVLAH